MGRPDAALAAIGPLDTGARTALEASHLGSLPATALAALTADASHARVPAAAMIHVRGETAAHLELVVAGLARVYVAASDGRTLTVRYCRPGALLGVVSLFRPGFVLPASIQAVTDVELLALRPATARRLSQRDACVAQAFLAELSERVVCFIAEIPGSAFSTVRQRVARHLLDRRSSCCA